MDFSDVADLFQAYKVGIVNTYIYPEEFTAAIKKYPKHADGALNEVTLLKKLSAGRNDAAITDPDVMQYLAKKKRNLQH